MSGAPSQYRVRWRVDSYGCARFVYACTRRDALAAWIKLTGRDWSCATAIGRAPL